MLFLKNSRRLRLGQLAGFAHPANRGSTSDRPTPLPESELAQEKQTPGYRETTQ
jgi:hypothetical protein